MAELAKNGKPSLTSLVPAYENHYPGLKAGEAIAQGDACYLKTSDGRIYRSNGSAAGEATRVDGFAPDDAPVGEACTLYFDVRFDYAVGMGVGTAFYLSATVPGGLQDASNVNAPAIVARAITPTRLHLKQSW